MSRRRASKDAWRSQTRTSASRPETNGERQPWADVRKILPPAGEEAEGRRGKCCRAGFFPLRRLRRHLPRWGED
ncbi:hypothetical protein CA606_20100 [Caulobacter vibrioides]|uniref:Uncharacterized protein n=1 Tax=Caulobacter vibrioides TaxID=155892 RepID=A0A2S1B7K9_CAUVI|nr:hypothetical protein CA606_20100 [Caulobacter vibrioides]